MVDIGLVDDEGGEELDDVHVVACDKGEDVVFFEERDEDGLWE